MTLIAFSRFDVGSLKILNYFSSVTDYTRRAKEEVEIFIRDEYQVPFKRPICAVFLVMKAVFKKEQLLQACCRPQIPLSGCWRGII
jgi:hypothetical protein